MHQPNCRTLLSAFSLILLCAISTFSAAEVTVFPGQTVDFYHPFEERVIPDVIGGEKEFLLAIAAIGDLPPTLPLSSFLMTSSPIGRANTSIFQYNTVVVDSGDGTETVLTGQISGTVNIKGFMFLSGWGLAESQVAFEVIDVTPGLSDTEHVIARHTLSTYKLQPSYSISAGASLGAKVGSATAGVAGGDLSLGIDIPVSKLVIRDEVPFGFTVLLRRGHTYRLQLVCENKVKIGRSAGRAIISMYNPIAGIPPILTDDALLTIPPSLLDPQEWSMGLNIGLLDKSLPSWSFPDRGVFAWDWWDDYNDTNDILAAFGIPTTPRGLISRYFNRVIPDEELAQPGVDLRRMELTLATDEVEMLNLISDQVEELKEIILRHPPFTRPPNGRPFQEIAPELQLDAPATPHQAGNSVR